MLNKYTLPIQLRVEKCVYYRNLSNTRDRKQVSALDIVESSFKAS